MARQSRERWFCCLCMSLVLSLWTPARAQSPSADLNEARTLAATAAERFQAGRVSEAAQLARRALDLREKFMPAGHPDVAEGLYDLGYYLQALGQLAEAEPFLVRALDIREKASPPRPREVAQSVSGLGVLRQVQGRFTEAEILYKRALDLREKTLPLAHALIATSLNNLAYLYQLLGRSSEAEPLHKRALAIWEKELPPGHPQLAWSLINLGILYLEQGRIDEAEPLQRRALEIREKALPPGHADIARSLDLIGTIQQRRRQYREAEATYRRALTMLEAALPSSHPDIASAVSNLAIVLDVQGRLAEAEAAYNRALAIRETSLSPTHPAIASNLSNLAILLRRQGRLADAERLLKRVMELQERALPPGHPSVAKAISNLSVIEMVRQNWPAALAYALQTTSMVMAREARERQGIAGVTDLSTGSGSAGLHVTAHDFHGLVKVAHRVAADEPGRRAELVETTFSRAQWAGASEAAASLAQMAARNARDDPRLAQLVRQRQDLVAEWRARDKALVTSATLPPERRNAASDQQHRQRLASMDREIKAIDRTLTSDFAEYSALSNPEPVSVGEAQRLLDENEALVFLLDTARMSEQLPEETFVWVVTKTSTRWIRSKFGGSALRESVLALRCGLDAASWHGAGADRCAALLALPSGKAPRAGDPLPFDAARAHALYKSLFGEAAELIREKHLLIVPSGALTTLPFQVLATELPRPGDLQSARWLIHDHAITVLPSVASLKALRRTGRPSAAAKPMIGFANPLLDGDQAHPELGAYFKQQAQLARAQTGCAKTPEKRTASLRAARRSLAPLPQPAGVADLKHLRMQAPLPETADEVCEVARAVAGNGDDVRIGARATEAEVKRLSASGELARYRILHFATHGTLAGQLSGTREPGLILSPPATATADDDGYLSGSEIAALKLDADWVILSACNTAGPAGGGQDEGAGQSESAEALSGLARVFFYAGARALLVSHWEVDSQAAVKLVTEAVGVLSKDMSVGRAEALRRAMLAAIADTSRPANWVPAWHPSVWAPFVVVGEGGRGH